MKYIHLLFNDEKRNPIYLKYDGVLEESRMVKKCLDGLKESERNQDSITMKVMASRITEDAIAKLTKKCEDNIGGFDVREVIDPEGFSGFSEFCECMIAIGYLGIDSVIEKFRREFLNALSSAGPMEASRKLFDTVNDVLDESKVNEIFKGAWKKGFMKEKKCAKADENEYCFFDDGSNDNEEDDDDDDDRFNGQSIYLAPSKAVIGTGTKTSFVPKMILEKRSKVDPKSNKCCVDGCSANCESFFQKTGTWLYGNSMHHCRSCGFPVCDVHSKNFIKMPYKPIKYRDTDDENGPLRVCDECYKFLTEDDSVKVEPIFCAMAYMGIPLRFAARAAWFSDIWNEACVVYWNIVRNIQTKSPAAKINDFERNFLWFNRNEFPGHNYWLIQFLRAVDWSDPFEAQEAERIVTSKGKGHCVSLSCKQTCSKNGLRCLDAIALLNGRFYGGLTEKVREFLVDIIRKSPTREFMSQITQLVFFTTYEPCPLVPPSDADEAALKKSPLTYMLLERLTLTTVVEEDDDDDEKDEMGGKEKVITDRRYALELYWAIRACLLVPKYHERFEVFKKLFSITLHDTDPEFDSMLSNEELFLGEIKRITNAKIAKGADERRINSVICERLNKFLKDRNVFVPYDPFKIIKSVTKVERLDKEAKPLILECECEDRNLPPQPQPPAPSFHSSSARSRSASPTQEDKMSSGSSNMPSSALQARRAPASAQKSTVRFMYKAENLTNDVFVTKFLSFVRKILEYGKKCYEDLEVYNVMSVEQESGFIEMLSGKTWESIEKEREALPKFIKGIASNAKAKETYLNSIIIWTVLSYILGIGNRHKENFMITKSGRYANIDFDFIFGEDPHSFLESYSRIPDSGIGKEDEEKIVDKCKEIFIFIRKYAPHIVSFFSLIKEFPGSNRNCSYVEKKLALDNVECEAEEYILIYVSTALKMGHIGRDMMHNLGKCWKYLKDTWSWMTATPGNENENGDDDDDDDEIII